MALLKPWTREKVKCKRCSKEFVSQIYKRRKFCSEECSNKFKLENPEYNYQWNGAKSYGLRHAYIRKRLGTPNMCLACGETNIKIAKQFDWASISTRCLLNLNDWIRLCRRCHQRWDDGIIILEINFVEYKRPHRLLSYNYKNSGVYLKKGYKIKKWRAKLGKKELGYFKTKKEAKIAYDTAVKTYIENFIPKKYCIYVT